MNSDSIPLAIRPYFIEIAERLWTGHASVMVGAGFSKNSINKADQNKGMPNWNELGDIFYEKIHGEAPNHRLKYLNPLKLADEVQAAFGRSVLEQILKQHIPDKDFDPSDAHTKLLELPWSDVFTTNYDTLLERSCENVISRRYDVVINQKDIVYSNRPRIIKLHGSFPSERPLIITEEDYRVYPKQFAPFVNTVQQSLLENTLCLVGFSGDDPNFLQWIGWINDNIGKDNSPKIYLIGILSLSEAQKKLLASKNIVTVDLSTFLNVNGDHKKGILFFLDFLQSQRKSRKNLEWAMDRDYILTENLDVKEVIRKWKARRLTYPNWIICPQENREALWDVTNELIANDKIWNNLSYPYDIEFLYELSWRLEKCLFPIYNHHIQHFEKILGQYNPFPIGEINSTAPYCFADESVNLDWFTIKQWWLHLTLSTLRFYREEGFHEKWKLTSTVLETVKSHLSAEQNAWYHYEKVLMGISESDIDAARKNLLEWTANEYDPFWDAKRAMLLAEFGLLEEANTILEACLTTVRKRLNLSPVGIDYKWVSQEAYIMFLFQLVRSNLHIYKDITVKDGVLEDFNERWNSLLQFKCSPWQEKKYFDTLLQHKYTPKKDKSTKENFEIGMSTISYHIGGQDSGLVIAYNFLRFIEEVGIPLGIQRVNVDDKTLKGTLERIYPNSPHWAYAVANRSRTSDTAEIIFDRPSLINLSEPAVDRMVLNYLDKYYSMLPEHSTNTVANNFVKKVPKVLSRLCVKCSAEVKLKIFEFLVQVLNSGTILKNMGKLWNILIDSSNDEIKTQIIPLLFTLPVIGSRSSVAQIDFKEPFENLNVNLTNKPSIPSHIINDLLKKALDLNNLRYRALTRLMFLYHKDLLNSSYINKLFTAFWTHVDKDGFPADTPYYKFAYRRWRHSKNENADQLFKTYIMNNTFSIQGSSKLGIGMGGGKDRYAEELLYGSASINNPDMHSWTTQELSSIVDKCVIWWESDRHYLIGEQYKSEGFGGSIYREFLGRFKLLNDIICRVFGYQKSAFDQPTLLKITNIIKVMEYYDVPILKSKIAFAESLKYTPSDFIAELENNMICGVKDKITDAFHAASMYISHFDASSNAELSSKILDIIVQPLKWRKVDLMEVSLSIINNLLKHKPQFYPNVKAVLLGSLKYLVEFTDIGKDKFRNEVTPAEALLIRQRAMKLANTIYKIDPSNPPQEVLEWEKIAQDANEFSDITNRWVTFEGEEDVD